MIKRFLFDSDEIAFIICDMFDSHWCKEAQRRYDCLAKKIGSVVDVLHETGVRVIHAPSGVMEYYKEYPQRKMMDVDVPLFHPLYRNPWYKPPRVHVSPPLQSDEGSCSCGCPIEKAWMSQHPLITIGDDDVISDSVEEIMFFLQKNDITHLFYAGVSCNLCILRNQYGILMMKYCGFDCYLVRDLTDVWYNEKEYGSLTRSKALELMVSYIEKNICPSIHSSELIQS